MHIGADPQPVQGDAEADRRQSCSTRPCKDSSQLVALREKAPVGRFALVTRARDDLTRFQAALNSFGYYKAKMTLTIDGPSA